jgi:hypothetical protein
MQPWIVEDTEYLSEKDVHLRVAFGDDGVEPEKAAQRESNRDSDERHQENDE